MFDDFVRSIIELYQGKVTIVLFGSRARGNYWPSSDYDLMIFLEDVKDETLEATRILQLRKEKFPVDVVVKRPSDLKDPITQEMLKYRKVLYDGLKLF